MTRGIRTSEFWVAIIAGVLMEINALTNGSMDVVATAAIWGPAAAYIVSRGLAKLGKNT